MTISQIDSFIRKIDFEKHAVKVSLKTRNPFIGYFVNTNDYDDLKGKNFWRVVGQNNIQKYLTNRNNGLSKLISGTEIINMKVFSLGKGVEAD